MNKNKTFVSILSFLLLFAACKKEAQKEDEVPVVLEKRCYPIAYSMEYDGESEISAIEYNSDNLIKKVEAYGNEEYLIEYGYSKKLERITYKTDGEITFLQNFYYNSDGIMLEIHSYQNLENANLYQNKHNLPIIERLKKIAERNKIHIQPDESKLVLLMVEKFWLNNDLVPDKIETINPINDKISEARFSYDTDGNIEKEELYDVNFSTSELELHHVLKIKFDDKKSPGYDVKNINRFTFLANFQPYLKHAVNNPKESSFELANGEVIKHTYKNKYTEDGYLAGHEHEEKENEKASYEYKCQNEKVE